MCADRCVLTCVSTCVLTGVCRHVCWHAVYGITAICPPAALGPATSSGPRIAICESGAISASPTACPLRGYGLACTQNGRLGERRSERGGHFEYRHFHTRAMDIVVGDADKPRMNESNPSTGGAWACRRFLRLSRRHDAYGAAGHLALPAALRGYSYGLYSCGHLVMAHLQFS